MRFGDARPFSDDSSPPRSPIELPTGATDTFDTTALSISFVDFDTPDFDYQSASSSQSPPTPLSSQLPPSSLLRSPSPSPPLAPPEPMPRHVRYRIAVCRWAPLVLPVGLLGTLIFMLVSDLTQADTNANASGSSNSSYPVVITDWNPCTLDSSTATAKNLSAQCTLLALPLCHDGVCSDPDNHTINVFIKRIPSTSASPTTSVWYIPDRPDAQSSSESDHQMTLLYEQLNGTTSIYRMDMRGTGQSSPLTCSVDLASAVFNPERQPTSTEVQQCADDVRALYGDRLAAFSLTSAAHDLKATIETYQTETSDVGEDEDVVVYALGYGTHIAQRMIQLETDGVVGYVMDSPLATADSQTSSSLSRGDADFGEIGDAFLDWCMSDDDCAAMFPNTSLTNVSATLEAAFVRLDAGNDCSELFVTNATDSSSSSSSSSAAGSESSSSSSSDGLSTPPSYLLRKQLAVLMEDSALRPLVPVVIHRANRCGAEDVGVLSRVSKQLTETIKERDDSLELVHAIQAFSELWEAPSPSQLELLERFTTSRISNGQAYDKLAAYCLFTGDSSSSCDGITTSEEQLLGFERDGLGTGNVSLPSSISVLVLSGDMDGLAPTKYAKALENAITSGGGKQLLVVANGPHNVVDSTTLPDGSSCGRQVLASFIQSSGNLGAVDASCLSELPPASLAVSSALSTLVLNVTDAYDGELDLGSSSGDVDDGEPQQSSSASAASLSSSNSSSTDADSLTSSRNRYKLALIIVGSVCGSLAVLAAAVALYRRHQKRELDKEEDLLRRMRGSADDDFELLRGLYLSSFSYRTDPSAS
jgi:pimeloyl-ACP methyl ester carboxylesterase